MVLGSKDVEAMRWIVFFYQLELVLLRKLLRYVSCRSWDFNVWKLVG